MKKNASITVITAGLIILASVFNMGCSDNWNQGPAGPKPTPTITGIYMYGLIMNKNNGAGKTSAEFILKHVDWSGNTVTGATVMVGPETVPYVAATGKYACDLLTYYPEGATVTASVASVDGSFSGSVIMPRNVTINSPPDGSSISLTPLNTTGTFSCAENPYNFSVKPDRYYDENVGELSVMGGNTRSFGFQNSFVDSGWNTITVMSINFGTLPVGSDPNRWLRCENQGKAVYYFY